MVMVRPRHPDKDLERLLRGCESAGWRFEKGKKYYKGRCGCGDHRKTVKLTPSNPNYLRNVRQWFKRQRCWGDHQG